MDNIMDTHRVNHAKRDFWSRAQSGQAIVLLMVGLVVLIGAVGLALDGGGMFFLQRDAQNAADAAVLASTYARCTGAPPDEVVAAGVEAARQNGFVDGEGGRTVEVYNPPIHGEKATAPDRLNYIEVNISADKPAYFIQVVYKGPLEVTVHTVGYCDPPFYPATLKAIIGLSTNCTNTVKWGGSTATFEGGVFSNNDVQFTGSDNVIDGGVQYMTDINPNSSGNNVFGPPGTSVADETVTDPLANIYDVYAYSPDGAILHGGSIPPIYKAILPNSSPGSATYDPAYNDSNHTWNVDNRTLEGMYYVDGNVSLGQHIVFNGSAHGGQGVAIIATGWISGTQVTDATYYEYPGSTGVLFFSNYASANCGNDAAISVSGDATQWWGLIYAPHGAVKVSGSSLDLHGVIVAQTVEMDASNLIFSADTNVVPPHPPLVKIAE